MREVHDFLMALGKCHQTLEDHRETISTHPAVTSTIHQVRYSSESDAFVFSECVDVELRDGNAISWYLELTMYPTCVSIDADVFHCVSQGGYRVANIAEERLFTDASVCAKELIEITQNLCAIIPKEMEV